MVSLNITKYFVNRGSSNEGELRMRVLSRKRKLSASILAFVVAAVMVFGLCLCPQSAGAAENTVADDLTVNNWHDSNALDDSTKSVGRIWTDKSVSTKDVTLTGPRGEKDTKTIEKDTKSDFLVGLSALSSTAKIMGQTTVPLDIVLVLDVSGSMDDPSGGYTEVYQLDTSKSYYIYSWRQYREVKYDSQSQRWYYQDWLGHRQYVSPKTSAEDSDSSHVQFYSDGRVKKIDTLKKAVNNFIDTTAAENDKRSDVNKQNRISLVKFAGNETDKVGNDTYRDGGYTFNYTQIVSNYEAYTRSTKKQLQDKVNALKPAGATRADFAMEHAQGLVKDSIDNRKDAKRIVIFFTDGEPTSGNQFEDRVANKAINTAKGIKSDADIYTIGVFESANAADTQGRFNAYMHGMSSNYPNATAYNKLGDRVPDSNFYKAAENASTLNSIFDTIAEEIVSSAQSPTHVEQGESPAQSGYITFTDQLGNYMQVDGMNTLLYGEKTYTKYSKESSGNKDTYTFTEQITDPNPIYPTGDLSNIKITVEKSENLQTGDLVTVKIPANMIPLRYYEVTKEGKTKEGKMTITNTDPMRLFYNVSLKADAKKKIENPDDAMQAYIAANTNGDGQVQFYSNQYDKKSGAIGAYAHFVPATTNDFYYFQEDAFLYTDEACTKPATGTIDTSGKTTYYYQRDYYKLGSDGKAEKKTNTVTIPGNSNLLLQGYAKYNEKANQYYIPAGTPRTTSLTYFTENKETGANKTDTAKTSIKPVWENDFRGNSVTTYLGNNGRVTFDLPGQLDISKTVKAEEGHTVPDSLKEQAFEYKLELTAKEGSKLKAEYTAQKYNGAKADGDSFKIKPGDTFTLKDGQTLKIYGLAPGTEYTVTETKADHFTAAVAQDNAETGKDNNGGVFAKGTIPGNDVASAAFTNTYKAAPATLDGSATFKVHKDFVTPKEDNDNEYTSAWSIEYLKDSVFTFYLTADDNESPMPDDATMLGGTRTSVRKVTNESSIDKTFGDITYTKPGTYQYRIAEDDTGTPGKQGVSYSAAAYTVTVTVTDNNGALKADAVMKKIRNDAGTQLEPADTVDDNTAVFRNIYETNKQAVDAEARKEFTDHTGSKKLKNGDYTFRITAINGAPLSNGETSIDAQNIGIGVRFTSKEFTLADAAGATKTKPITYEYWMEEVLPKEANEGNHYTVNGLTYDTTKYKIHLNVYVESVNGKDTVVVDRIYKDANGNDLGPNEVPVFRNSYRADPVKLTGDTALKGEKTLTGRDMLSGETFDFTLTAGDDATAKAIKDNTVAIAENDDKASVKGGKNENDMPAGFHFGDVTFTKEGTYTFDIKETVPSSQAGGMTYDQHITKATVIVTDDTDHSGKLKASVTYDNGTVSNAKDKAVFQNTYEASFAYETTGGLLVEKVLNGRTMKQGEFGFTIEAQGDAPAVSKDDAAFTNPQQRASGEADSMQKLLGLRFDQDDAGKTFTYLVKEDKGSAKGVTYDETRFLVAIKVMDKGDGTLYTITTITPQTKGDDGTYTNGTAKEFNSATDPDNKPALRFTNTYEAGEAAPVSVTDGFSKELTGRDWRDSDKFIFTIANIQKPDGVETAPMPAETDVIVTKADLAQNGKAPFDFGSITFTKAGVYKYKVTEQQPVQAGENTIGMNYDLTPRIITVTVTDDGTGQLKAAVTAVENSKTFTNKYVTEDLPLDTACGIKVTKVLYGHDMADGQFEFSLKAKDKASADKLRIDKDNGATFTSTAAAAGETATLLDSLQMTMTQSDIDKTYSYTFAETKGNAAGYTYDDNTYKLDVTTHDAGDGTLTATVVLTNTKTNKKLFQKTVSEKDKALGENGVVIPFENRYDGSTDVNGGTKATISAKKTLNGRTLKDREFTFKLATRPAKDEGTVLQTKANKDDGTISFDDLSYRTSDKAAGSGTILSQAVRDGYGVKSTNDAGKTVYTLSYRVSETKGSLGGVSYTDTYFDFKVIVTDNGDGTLTAETQGKDEFEFVNTYSTGDPIPMDIKGSKVLNHAFGLSPADITGKFSFTLEAVTYGAPMPEKATANNDGNGNVDFGNITFSLDLLTDVTPDADGSRSKTFEYKVTESGSAPGVTNDTDKTKTFKITLKDDGNGKLTATSDPAEGPKFTFTNTYTVEELLSSITDQITINKQLTGRDLKEGEFSFELLEDSKVIATGSNDADGNVTFDKITYTQPGSHTYTVREVNNKLGGVTYDDQAYTVCTRIIDQGNGTLKAKHQVIAMITDNEAVPAEKNAITFSNKYKAAPTSVTVGAVKKLEGKALEAGQFTFQLKDADGKVIAEAKNDKTGAVMFDTVKFKEAGVYEYTVSEVNDKQANIKYDEHVYKIKVTVTDDGSGTLSAEVSDDSIVFTNHYTPAGTGTDTGDDSSMAVALGLMMMAATAGGAVLVRRKINQ